MALTLCILAFLVPLTIGFSGNGGQWQYVPNEHIMFVCNGTLMLAGICLFGWYFYKLAADRSQQFVAIIYLIVSLQLLLLTNSYGTHAAWDYLQIEHAASQLLAGISPYHEYTTYVLYPPLYSELLAGAYSVVMKFFNVLSINTTSASVWEIVFYFFENMQFVLLMMMLFLCHRFATTQCRLDPLRAACMNGVIFLYNAPMLIAIQCNQIGVLIAALMTFALVCVDRYPILCAFGIAIGANLKVYPIAFLIPWLTSKKIRPIVWTLLFLGIIFALEEAAGYGLGMWIQYFHTVRTYLHDLMLSPFEFMRRSPNMYSLVTNVGDLLFFLGFTPKAPTATVTLISQIAGFLTVIWFAFRYIRCERLAATLVKESIDEPDKAKQIETARLTEHCLDMISLMLLIGPTTLEHHYIFAIPVLIWTISRVGSLSPLVVGVGTFLTLTFLSEHLWPFSLAGLGLIALSLVRSRYLAAVLTK